MNRRFALLAAAGLFCALLPSVASSQVKPASSTPASSSPAPAAPAKWVPPMKGEVTIEFAETPTTKVKGELITKFKVRNTSKGSIALLSVERLYYAKTEIGSSGIYRHRKLLNPGEIIEFTINCPDRPGLDGRWNTSFRHAGGGDGNGKVTPKLVKKLE